MLNERALRLYRNYVFGDADTPRDLPQGLIELHDNVWHVQSKFMGRAELSPEMITSIYLAWLTTDPDGRKHMERQPFVEETEEDAEAHDILKDWDDVPEGTMVLVNLKDRSKVDGSFAGIEGKFIKIETPSGMKKVRASNVAKVKI